MKLRSFGRSGTEISEEVRWSRGMGGWCVFRQARIRESGALGARRRISVRVRQIWLIIYKNALALLTNLIYNQASYFKDSDDFSEFKP